MCLPWYVIDAANGSEQDRIQTNSGAHNTLVSLDGRAVYLGGLSSPILFIAETKSHQIVQRVGPFSGSVRPFVIDHAQRRAFVCVNGCLGFEVADLVANKVLDRFEVPGFSTGPVKRHGCVSHGIGLTPDESEIWVADAFNHRLHVYDNSGLKPQYKESVSVREEPGWITFSIDGSHAYSSTGEVIDVKSKNIVYALKDELDRPVHSEKMLEIHVRSGRLEIVGDQFGLGRKPLSGSAESTASPENR